MTPPSPSAPPSPAPSPPQPAGPVQTSPDNDVRIFTWSLAAVAVLLMTLIAGGLYWKRQHAASQFGVPSQTRTLLDFQLLERSGRPVNRDELQGKILVVNFVFTGCSLACYEVSRHMAEIQGYVAQKPEVQLISFSVDPRTDTPEVLSGFADRLKADPKRWLFLTGDKDTLYHLIETSFLPKAPPEAPSLIPGNFDRAERLVLVDGSGRIRRYFDGMNPNSVGEVLDAITELNREATR